MCSSFPSQLFAETVLKDVMFGPLNLGVSPAQAKEQALTALEALKLPSDINERSPFELSGGQMRRVPAFKSFQHCFFQKSGYQSVNLPC